MTSLFFRKFAFLFSFPVVLCFHAWYRIELIVMLRFCAQCLWSFCHKCAQCVCLAEIELFLALLFHMFICRAIAQHMQQHFLLCRLCTVFLLIVVKLWIIIWFIPWDAALHGSRSFPDTSLITATQNHAFDQLRNLFSKNVLYVFVQMWCIYTFPCKVLFRVHFVDGCISSGL